MSLHDHSKSYFSTPLSEFVYYRTYSRWVESQGRRETWIETVDRYVDFMHENLQDRLRAAEYQLVRTAILEQKVMPSMRLLWSAGSAARSTHVAAYNCSYLAPSKVQDLAELMYILMCGTGVGFSVERQVIAQFPKVEKQRRGQVPVHRIEDSKEGWCDALKNGMEAWFRGKDITFDYSRVRLAGARLKTMGGRSSGPQPLKSLLTFARSLLLRAEGRHLTSLELYDLICKIGEVVVMGGVRRSALISLSDLDDEDLRNAKRGHFYIENPHRSLANNSAVYPHRPPSDSFLQEWTALARSGTGERGIFNRGSLEFQIPERRRRSLDKELKFCGTNPCGEIVLRSKQFCNLSEVIARSSDTEKTLKDKIKVASLIGTYQATLTSFPYLSSEWKKNCEEERLLGVSITGMWDCPAVREGKVLQRLRALAVSTNQRFADRFGIRSATAVTCIKPSGTVSQMVNSSSGIHPRFSKYYVRRIRISALDPIFLMLKKQNFPVVPEVGQIMDQASTYVLEFPVRAPRGAIVKDHLNAVDQLEFWKKVKTSFTEHNPSSTVFVGSEEWVRVADWVYTNWDIIGGLTFLPHAGGVYQLAPFEEISKQEYEERLKHLPQIDFSQLSEYEKEDLTIGARVPSCVGGNCEVDPEEDSVIYKV